MVHCPEWGWLVGWLGVLVVVRSFLFVVGCSLFGWCK